MRVYLDLCCLKRPFDLQDQPVIRLQLRVRVTDPVQFIEEISQWTH